MKQPSHTKRTWSEAEVAKVARREANRIVTDKRNRLLEGGGFLALDGPIHFEDQGHDKRATVDGVDVNTFLNLHLTNGQTVKLVVIQLGT